MDQLRWRQPARAERVADGLAAVDQKVIADDQRGGRVQRAVAHKILVDHPLDLGWRFHQPPYGQVGHVQFAPSPAQRPDVPVRVVGQAETVIQSCISGIAGVQSSLAQVS